LGFDKYGGLLEILIAEEVVEKEGGQYVFDGEELGSSMSEALETLIDDPELLSDACVEANIIMGEEMQKRLDDITENRYPVTEDLFPKKGKEKAEEADEE
jgi:hypothetical protein